MFFAHQTQTGFAVCRLSCTLGGAVVEVDCTTLASAEKIAAQRNLEAARDRAAWQREDCARMVRRSVRSCLPDLLSEH